MSTPGSSATTKEAPTGRQRPKHVAIKHVICSVALSGLSFVNAIGPGVLRFAQAQAEDTPVCSLSRLRRFSPDTNNPQEANMGICNADTHVLWDGKSLYPIIAVR